MRRLRLSDQKIDCKMLNEVGKGCADELVTKAAEAPLLADVLCERGVRREHRRRETFANAQMGRCDANDNAHRVVGDARLLDGNAQSVYPVTRFRE
jgi:hypothetical protein